MSDFEIHIDPGSAPPELLAKILFDLSDLDEVQGGNGLTFEVVGPDPLPPKEQSTTLDSP